MASAARATASDVAAMPRHDTARPRGRAPSGSSGISGPATGRVRWRARVVGATAAARSMPGVYERTFETASGRVVGGRQPCLAFQRSRAARPRSSRCHRHPLGGLGEGGVTAGVAGRPARRRRGRLLLGLEVLERRGRHARLPVLVEVADDVGQPLRRGALGQVDGDDVGVHVHPGGLPGGEQAPGQLGGRTGTEGVGRRAEVLVAHPGQRPVQLEPHDPRRRARLLRDRDHLTHRRSVTTARRPRCRTSWRDRAADSGGVNTRMGRPGLGR